MIETTVMICITLIVLACIVSYTYLQEIKIKDDKKDKYLIDEMKRLQQQANEMYKMYCDLKECIDKE